MDPVSETENWAVPSFGDSIRWVATYPTSIATRRSLAVELEGRIHDQAHQREYDAVRREAIEQLGVRILVFKNEQVTEDLEGVLAQILRAIMSQQKERKS